MSKKLKNQNKQYTVNKIQITMAKQVVKKEKKIHATSA